MSQRARLNKNRANVKGYAVKNGGKKKNSSSNKKKTRKKRT